MRLERQGHAVIEARDQPEAVKMLQQAQPALVLSDLRLPEGDGFGVLRASKEIDADVPVIVMTAYGSIEDAVTAMKEGALDFLAKPVDPDHLLLLVGARARSAPAGDRKPADERGAGGAPRRAAAGRRRLLAAQGVCVAAARGRHRYHCPHRRGERHRQRAVRAIAACAQPARRRAVCGDQLRRHPGDASRNRAVRP